MLMLSRNVGESIIITVDGREIEIKIDDIKTFRQVRIGIEADKDIKIMRKELIHGRVDLEKRGVRS
jgi:carbon storage regulator CsrA